MIRYGDYLTMPNKPDNEVVDPEFLDRMYFARVLGLSTNPDGNHRSPKSRIGSRASAQRPGFKKRPRRNNKP